MNTKVRYFYTQKFNNLLQEENYQVAEKILKSHLKDEYLPHKEKSKVYELLGVLKFQTGNYSLAKKYYNLSLKYNVQNINSLLNLSNILIIENKFYDAINLLKKYIPFLKGRKEILKTLVSCYSFIGDITHSKIIFDKITTKDNVDEQTYVDYSYGYVLNKNFEEAKKILLTGLSKYPDSFILFDAYEEFTEIEVNMKNIKKEVLIPFLKNLNKLVFVKAATLLTENMCIRGYFNFEIEKGLDLIKIFHDNNLNIKDSVLLAAICEYFTTLSISDAEFTLNTIANFYNLNKSRLKKHVLNIETEFSETIETFLSELNLFYNIELDKISEELDGFDE